MLDAPVFERLIERLIHVTPGPCARFLLIPYYSPDNHLNREKMEKIWKIF